MEDGLVKVVSPIEGSPAFRAGLKSGDLISKIDDTFVKGLTMDQAVKRMRGEPATKVVLTVYRKDENRSFPVTIVREEIRVQSVRAKVVEPGYGWLRVTQFQDRTVDDFVRKLDEIYKSEPQLKGLVLDLRNDAVGLLEGAVALSAAFLPADATVVSTNGQLPDSKAVYKATPEHYVRRGSDPLKRLPAAVKSVPLGFAGRSNIYFSKVVAAGIVLWEKTYGGDNNILVTDGVQTPDGGGIILATLLRFPKPGDYIYLLNVNADGDEVWSRTWEEGTLGAYDLIPTSDGAYLIVGSYTPPEVTDHSQADFLFIKVDSEGNEIWRTDSGRSRYHDYGQVAIETADGGFVAAGDWERDLTSWNSDIAVVKIDANGKLVWKQIIETNTHSMFGTLLLHPDGGYIIAGSRWRDPQWDVFLIKTDSEGKIEK